MPLLSVIVPVYKTEQYLPQCLDSLVAQTLQDLELILIDDGSPDNCGQICDSYAAKYPHIRVIHQKNSGQTASRCAGLAVAQGKYIAFSDSDDWVEPDMYQKMVDVAQQQDADMVFTGFIREYENRSEPYADPVESGLYTEDTLQALLCRAPFDIPSQQQGLSPALWNKLLRKDLAADVFFSADDRIRFGEDALCVYGALMKAKRVVVAGDQKGYHYRIWENSVTQAYNPKFFHDLFILHDRLEEIFSPVAAEVAPALAYNYIYLYHIGLSQLATLHGPEKYQRLNTLSRDLRLAGCVERIDLNRLPEQMRKTTTAVANRQLLPLKLRWFYRQFKNKLHHILQKV